MATNFGHKAWQRIKISKKVPKIRIIAVMSWLAEKGPIRV